MNVKIYLFYIFIIIYIPSKKNYCLIKFIINNLKST